MARAASQAGGEQSSRSAIRSSRLPMRCARCCDRRLAHHSSAAVGRTRHSNGQQTRAVHGHPCPETAGKRPSSCTGNESKLVRSLLPPATTSDMDTKETCTRADLLEAPLQHEASRDSHPDIADYDSRRVSHDLSDDDPAGIGIQVVDHAQGDAGGLHRVQRTTLRVARRGSRSGPNTVPPVTSSWKVRHNLDAGR
jgi:hypothetical protein